MRKVWAIAWKELRQASRDRLTLVMLLGVPAMMLLLYGYALNFDVKRVRLAVQDLDRSSDSRELIAAFTSGRWFDLVASLPAGEDLHQLLQARRAKAVLVIPAGYGDARAAARAIAVQLIVDGTDANTATTLLSYANAAVLQVERTQLQAVLSRAGRAVPQPIELRPRVWYNPELRSSHFLVPGLMGFILMLTAVLSTAMSVVREKERGTMEQLQVAPVRPGHLIAGKALPYLAISLVATVVILVVARVLFGVEVQGPYLDLFAITLLYLMGALGFGLLVSSMAQTQAMAYQFGTVTSLLPAILLSGFIFPIRSMPEVLQAITYAVPARYYLVVLRGVILKGSGLGPYWRDVLFLAAYGLVVFTIAYRRMAKREAAS